MKIALIINVHPKFILCLIALFSLLLSLHSDYNEYHNERYSGLEEYSFSISYVGVTVANVKLINEYFDGGGRLYVTAKSTTMGRLLFPINNSYSVEYVNNYLPKKYVKDIQQRNFSLQKKARFYRQNNTVTITNDESETIIPLNREARDFFSSLFVLKQKAAYLSEHHSGGDLPSNNSVVVYANNNFWRAVLEKTSSEEVNGVQAEVYEVRLNSLTKYDHYRSDVLTNNIIKKDTLIKLWFSSDDTKLPIKAEFTGSPFSVFWYLDSSIE